MSTVTLLPFIVLIGAMFLMTRSAKKKQQAAAQMRNEMQPGTGVRTIGGMYATVKEIHDETVLLEVAPGVHAVFAKNAIGAVLADEEYNRIIDGADPVVPDDISSLTGDDATTGSGEKSDKIDLGKGDAAAADEPEADEKPADEAPAATSEKDASAEEKKSGDAEAKKSGDADAK
ncbi:preprotein translocase subunit YajC [Streptomyces sp. NBC_01525]|uniref:Preprotein translocase subunit YajC n=1 Tax=Streptomyces benahoarensis TaxID=2595054 RepID=A0A553ZM68_9ACTN|nr:preprotein translocase subunit YajC [Streptomyces benahoarensis]TSB32314.1 preprotein translocase subunit YajC [Streptomyces benahoarensis]TSB42396.1 preprotein translocase subunit YajC [Streptomyces benahoarensis]